MVQQTMTKTVSLYTLLLCVPSVLGHMEMSWPYPLRSKFNPDAKWTDIDYSMTSPLEADGSNFPCKGYQNDLPAEAVTSYTAGQTYNMTLAGSVTHGGGSCQLSLSYDNGATFRVIKSMIGGCPMVSEYDFTVPSYAPAGQALLAWSWQNYEGRREFYMNCAAVEIASSDKDRRQPNRREEFKSFDDLPFIWKANMPTVNDCTTVERQNPVYPQPGPDVEYANDMNVKSVVTDGDCAEAKPYGPTYRKATPPTNQQILPRQDSPASATPTADPLASLSALSSRLSSQFPDTTFTISGGTVTSDNTQGLETLSSIQSILSSIIPIFSLPIRDAMETPPPEATGATMQTRVRSDSPQETAPLPKVEERDATTSADSTTTVTVDCPYSVVTVYVTPTSSTLTVTATTGPSIYTTSAPACTGTSAQCPCASGYGCLEAGACTWACQAMPTSTGPTGFFTTTSTPSSVIMASPTTTSSSSRSSHSSYTGSRTWSSTARPTATSGSHPPYASGDPEVYLPCVPGTFICTSSTMWSTCDYNDGTTSSSSTWVYDYPRNVSAGMECITFLSPYSSSNSADAQQAMTPQGYYRDDRVVRARPDGDCSEDGTIMCTDSGQMFDVCDQGGWVPMGAVAAGTTCQNGEIVAS